MANFSLRGPLCVLTNALPNDAGTLTRGAAPARGPIGTNPDAGALLKPARSSPEGTFDTAIELFENAPQGTTAMGLRILGVLRKARETGALSFADLGEDGISSPSQGWIKITDRYQDDPAKASIWMVHEAYHVAVVADKMLYVDEEIESRRIQGEYSIYLEDTGGKLKDGKPYAPVVRSSSLSEFYRANRIIDWVIPQYKDEDDFKITADWIVKHKSEWGGFANRTLDTRKYYAKILVDSQPTGSWDPRSIDPDVAKTLRELLNSGPRGERPSIEAAAGKKEDLEAVLKAAPEAVLKALP
jgi:hypothetical protein